MKRNRFRIPIVVAAVFATALSVAACGSSDDSSAKDTDGAFVVEMVPHHESAIEMAKLAEAQGEHPQIKELAMNIIDSQGREIQQLSSAYQRLFDESVGEAGDSHGDLGIDEHMSGMDMDPGMLDGAEPFDREFIDMMIPHHQGAIRMARVELDRGEDEELMSVAESIIQAQTLEIQQMNAWRKSWYGAPSPAGGVPPVGESTDDTSTEDGMSGMSH